MKTFEHLALAVEAAALTTLRTGIGQYIYGLYKAMHQKHPQPTVNYFINKKFVQALPEAEPGHKENNHTAAIIKKIKDSNSYFSYMLRMINIKKYDRLFNRELNTLKVDLIHCPNFFCMGNKNIPEFITVHDISCFRHPETHPSIRVKIFNALLPASLEKSQHILTVSEFSKQELVSYFGVDPHKITVTYNGLPPQFGFIEEQAITATLQTYGLAYKKYFLYVGTIEPRKNLEILLDAYQLLPEQVKRHYKLVIIGSLGWKFENFMEKAKTLISNKQLLMPGFISEQELPRFMAGAHCFLYPSLYEGFGIPPLEAMASHTPVITSNQTSLPEVVGQAGILLPPDDALAWKDAIVSLVDDPKSYRHYVQQGLQQSSLFTWDACADQTLACFQRYK
jgi:glycosyltransferase involved in cell wall biosynthesis